jgi:hypothetical protein
MESSVFLLAILGAAAVALAATTLVGRLLGAIV